jgi:hypothetical protein
MELSYHSVLINSFIKPLKSTDHFYTVIVTLAELTIQRLYEKNPNTGTENWLLISLTPPQPTKKQSCLHNLMPFDKLIYSLKQAI